MPQKAARRSRDRRDVVDSPKRPIVAVRDTGDQKVVHMAQKLDAGTTFPAVKLTTVSGDTFTLPDDIASSYQVVLFYRGHW